MGNWLANNLYKYLANAVLLAGLLIVIASSFGTRVGW